MKFKFYFNTILIYILILIINPTNLYSKQQIFNYEDLFSKSRLHNFNDYLRTDKKLLNLTFLFVPYVTNNKIPNKVIGYANEPINKVKVDLFQESNNKFNMIVKQDIEVTDKMWTFKIPSNLSDGNYFVRASAKKNYIYFTFKIDSRVPVLVVDFPETFNTSDNKILISGAATPSSKINVKVNDEDAGFVNTHYSGNWSITPNKDLKIGYNKILINAFNNFDDPILKDEPATSAYILNFEG